MLRRTDGRRAAFRYRNAKKIRPTVTDRLSILCHMPRLARAEFDQSDGAGKMAWLRDIDTWFADHVFAHDQQTRRYALRLVRNPEEAEELVQEAYARLFALENWASIANPHAFTLRIVRNLAIERFRRADVVRLDHGAMLHSLEIADQEPTPDIVAMDRSELSHVVKMLQEMPPRMREAMVLRRIEGLPPAQVAERMNISVSTVETHLIKALRLLMHKRTPPGETEAKTEQAVQWECGERQERN